MSRINTNVSSLIAVNNLNKNNSSLQTSLERLSTGYRINSGKDDPSGLIASQSLHGRADGHQHGDQQRPAGQQHHRHGRRLAGRGIEPAGVACRAWWANAANSAGLSQDEKNADQLQVDSILSTINRISNSASFQGVKLLNGTFDYTTSGLSTTSAFTSVSINSAKVGQHGSGGGGRGDRLGADRAAQLPGLDARASTSAATISIAGNTGRRAALVHQRHQELGDRRVGQPVQGLDGRAGDALDRQQVGDLHLHGLRRQPVRDVTSTNTTALSTQNAEGVDARAPATGRNATRDGQRHRRAVRRPERERGDRELRRRTSR